MKKYLLVILCITFLAIAALGAYFGANNMINAIYDFRSPISNIPPIPGDPLSQPIPEKIVVVLVDALRLDTSQAVDTMPYLNHLREMGASATMHSQTPSYSAPGYSTLFIGAWPYLNDGPVFNLEYDDIPVWTQDNLFSAAHRNGITTGISAFNWFEKLVPQEDVDLSFYTPGEDRMADEAVVNAALKWLRQPGNQFILVHFDQVDYAGHHEGGASSQSWMEASKRADDLLAQIGAEMDLEQDVLIVLSDHGQINAGGHGGHESEVLTEPYVMAGKGIRLGAYPDIQMVDVAPTIAALLGANFPASSVGSVQTAMLELSDEAIDSYLESEAATHLKLTRLYSSAIGQPWKEGDTIESSREEHLAKERLVRLPFALVILLIPPFLVIWRKMQSIRYLLPGSLSAVLLFHGFYGVISRKAYSFSAIDSPISLIVYCAITMITAVILGFVVSLLVKQKAFNDRLDTTKHVLSFSFTTIYLWLIPFLWSFWLNGYAPTWTLPRMDAFFWALLALIGVLFTAAAGLLITAIYPQLWMLFRHGRKTR